MPNLHSAHATEGGEGRLAHLDWLRVYALLLVITVHASADVVVAFDGAMSSAWWSANVLDSWARPCVPLFVMISGALMLSSTRVEDTLGFFRRRALKVLLPFLGWAAVYFAWRIKVHHQELGPLHMLAQLISGPVYFHLWFVYVILGLYLVTPILRAWLRGATRTDRKYFCGLWFVGASALFVTERLVPIGLGVPIEVASGYVGYFVVGHELHALVSRRRLTSRERVTALSLLFASACVTCAASAFSARSTGKFFDAFYDYLSPNVIVMSVCSFLCIADGVRRRADRLGTGPKWIALVSVASFGTYLVHFMPLELIGGGRIGTVVLGVALHPGVAIPVTVAATFLTSLCIALVLRRIPGLRAFVP